MTPEENERLADIGREALEALNIKLRNQDAISLWGSIIEQLAQAAARIKQNKDYLANNQRLKKANSILNKLIALKDEIRAFDEQWPMSFGVSNAEYEEERKNKNKVTLLSKKQLYDDAIIEAGFNQAIWQFETHVSRAELDSEHSGGFSNLIGARDAGSMWSTYNHFVGKPTITKNPDDHTYRGNFLDFVRFVLSRAGVTEDDLADAGIYQAAISGQRNVIKNKVK